MDQNGLPWPPIRSISGRALVFHNDHFATALGKCFDPHCRTPVPGSAGSFSPYFCHRGNLQRSVWSVFAVAANSGFDGAGKGRPVMKVTLHCDED